VTPQIPSEIVALDPRSLEWLSYLDRDLWTEDQVALVPEVTQGVHFDALGL
ncbi:hypothetical protein PQX77_016970, partial [Marasmius sp. AFHP31]